LGSRAHHAGAIIADLETHYIRIKKVRRPQFTDGCASACFVIKPLGFQIMRMAQTRLSILKSGRFTHVGLGHAAERRPQTRKYGETAAVRRPELALGSGVDVPHPDSEADPW
jgi:hypothetical protein